METLKYLVFIPNKENERKSRAVIFPEIISHLSVKLALNSEGNNVISGGYCSIFKLANVSTPDKSKTLKVKVWGECEDFPNINAMSVDIEIIEKTLFDG